MVFLTRSIAFLLLILVTEVSLSSSTRSKRHGALDRSGKQYPPFGRQMRSEFLMAENFILLDHGAYGTYPKDTQQALRYYQDMAEANPDLWMRRQVANEMVKVRQELAQLMNVEDPDDLAMIINTTSGMNAIFRSMIFKYMERILHFTTIYGSMESLIQYVMDHNDKNVTALVFTATYPVSNDRLVQDFEKFMAENYDPTRPIRIALIDHITSVPGVIVPIERIIPILKRYGIEVLVDGAHAIGQVPIDIKALDPDYYITNCHKWLYAARGTAVMYVNKRHQGKVHPAHISSAYRRPADFQGEFFRTGTMDYSPYLTVPAAIKFRKDVGGEEEIRNYTHNLALEGGKYLASTYGTKMVQSEDQIGSMVDVELPLVDHNDPILSTAWWLDTLLYRFPTVFAAPYKHNGVWCARHSVQIYNDISDFEEVGRVFLQICDEVNTKNGTLSGSGRNNVGSVAASMAVASTVLAYEL